MKERRKEGGRGKKGGGKEGGGEEGGGKEEGRDSSLKAALVLLALTKGGGTINRGRVLKSPDLQIGLQVEGSI